MGGWITISGYCSSTFSPAPSAATGPGAMENGGAATTSRRRKKTWIAARITDAKALSRTSTRWRMRTTKPYAPRSHAHSSSEPSCPLHIAANLYAGFSAMLLCARMYSTEKSLVNAAHTRAKAAQHSATKLAIPARRAYSPRRLKLASGMPSARPTQRIPAGQSASDPMRKLKAVRLSARSRQKLPNPAWGEGSSLMSLSQITGRECRSGCDVHHTC